MTKRRTGFTVLELVTVIGIIVILMAILVGGYSHIIGNSKEKQTRVLLENCRNMMVEMENAVGLTQQPPGLWVNNQQLKSPNGSYDLWHYYDVNTKTNPQVMGALYANPSNGIGTEARGTAERFTSDAIANTQIAIGMLQQIPANKAMLSNLAAEQFLEAPPPGATSKLTPTGGRPQPPVLLDGWGNPIILAPASGILVAVSDPSTPGKVVNRVIRSPDNRPFWVSPGPDGAITDPASTPTKPYGEDNIYSFEHP